MTLPLSKIVNVQLNVQPVSSARRDFGMMALFTPEAGNIFADASTRYSFASSPETVELAFGTKSKTADAARRFFAQTPRPKQMMLARWQKTEATVAATSTTLSSGLMNLTDEWYKTVADGHFSIPLNGVDVGITGLDFTAAASFADVAAVLLTKLNEFGFTCSFTGFRFKISSLQTGVNQTIGFASDAGTSGTYVGKLLEIENGQGSIKRGEDAATLPAETLAEAFGALNRVTTGWYAASVADDNLTDAQIEVASDWIQASGKKVVGFTTSNAGHLEFSTDNVFKRLYSKQASRTAVLYDKTDPFGVQSWLARALSVNFSANNSTITMKFKQLPGVAADELTETEVAKCERLGINYYAYFDDTAMVAEGTVIGGRFFDEVHILDWLVDAVQKEVFAVLFRSPTKVPLTDGGTHLLISACNKVGREGMRNGAFAPGVWNGDSFGELATGDYLDAGFYVWADSVDNLSTSDREARKAPPIQMAVKLAGAIHSVDIIINFDR